MGTTTALSAAFTRAHTCVAGRVRGELFKSSPCPCAPAAVGKRSRLHDGAAHARLPHPLVSSQLGLVVAAWWSGEGYRGASTASLPCTPTRKGELPTNTCRDAGVSLDTFRSCIGVIRPMLFGGLLPPTASRFPPRPGLSSGAVAGRGQWKGTTGSEQAVGVLLAW
jgi:hypothetical protein